MMYGMASASTVAWVIYQKYCNGMPLYQLEQEPDRLGAKISRATLANWLIKNGEAFLHLCMIFSTENSRAGISQWQMKLRFRYCTNRDGAPRQNPTCGCSGARKMMGIQSSYINTHKYAPGTRQWIFWKATRYI